MDNDIRKIKKLINLVNETGIAELEIQQDNMVVRIVKNQNICPDVHKISYAEFPHVEAEISQRQAKSVAQDKEHAASKAALDESLENAIKSPMVGTVYLSPSPGSKPFVAVGQHIKAGDVICLVEAMKMFNRIESDKNGVVKAILVDNGQPVEYGQKLLIVE